jgi:hypothetical protein
MSLRRKPPAGNVRRVAAIGNNLRGTLTNKAGRIVQFESFAERSLLLRLERDQGVTDYASQPETFSAGDRPRYTPDFIVWRGNGTTEIHEVTRTERRIKESQQMREQLAMTICAERGWMYIMHTEDNLPQASELANLLSLLRYRSSAYQVEAISQATLCRLEPRGVMSLLCLANLLACEQGYALQAISASLCHDLWYGRLDTDWHQLILSHARFAPHARVWLPDVEAKS